MSGNEERQETVRCPHCGSERFALVVYGYNVKYFNSITREGYERGWESSESEGWQCDSCERHMTEDLERRLDELQ